MTSRTLPPVSSVVLFGSHYQDDRREGLTHLLSALTEGGFVVYIEPGFRTYLDSIGVSVPRECLTYGRDLGRPEAALSVGGDGTFLRAARRLSGADIPLAGINTGHLGFLTHYTLPEAAEIVADLKRGDASVETRMVLEVVSDSGETVIPPNIWPYALNEIALLKEDTASMIKVRMDVDGRFLTEYLADGVVISTPTGSTAYNLSAGGPLMQPALDCVAISPIAPHTLTLRPLVVSGCSHLHAVTTSRASYYRVSLDGCSFRVECDSALNIRRAPFGIPVIIRPGADFASALRHKLLWGQ